MKKIALIIFAIITFTCCKIFNNENDKDSSSVGNDILQINPQVFILSLPEELSEGSGLIYYDNLFWSFNDSGGENKIYGFNRKGEIEREVEIANAINVDWEDISQDNKYIYVGDFGNNSGARKDLKIYKINKDELGTGTKTKLHAEEICFNYQNQENFNFKPFNNEFDCEALVALNDNLYIFTKRWISQTTTLYKLPKNEGIYNLNPVDSFNVNGLVTGADISPNNSILVLVGYRDFKPNLRLFTDISGDQFFNGDKIFIEMDSIQGAQTEGVCFLGNDTILISCERTGEFEHQVFFVDLKNIFK